MSAREIPVAIPCEGDAMIGIIHVPERHAERGILAIVAGGPQYRGGCCRQLVDMARMLAAEGYAVMRFDYRGLGDSAGENKGFQHIGPDLDATIRAFVENAPGVREIVLWGGCDAASAAMIHGPRHPLVKGLILGNPFVHNEATHAKVIVKHYYLKRLREKAFWMKLLSLRMNPLKVFGSVLRNLKLSRQSGARPAGGESDNRPFPERMLAGTRKFQGRILLLMSGQSLVSKEFDQLVASSPAWTEAIRRPNVSRVDIEEADQAFSTLEAREKMMAAALRWLKSA